MSKLEESLDICGAMCGSQKCLRPPGHDGSHAGGGIRWGGVGSGEPEPCDGYHGPDKPR